MIKLLVLPKSTNPYQSLLYTPLKEKISVSYGFLKSKLCYTYPFVLLVERLRGTRLLHLHWLYWLTVRMPSSKLQQLFSKINIYLFVWLARILGFKIIRTMHNLLPHEPQTTDDTSIARMLARQSTVTIVHSSETTERMRELKIDTSKNIVIPIGSYDGIYPDTISEKQARKQLGISNKEFVILFFGIIREYKGIDDLLKAFKNLKLSNARLVIAGVCEEPTLAQKLLVLGRGLPVTFYNKFIPDNEVATFFKACNVVCLPFKQITTSSSVLLAMAFNKPVIAPRIGALQDIPNEDALFYTPETPKSLEHTIESAMQNDKKLNQAARNGYLYSQSLSWDIIASKTYDVYRSLLY